MLHFKMPRRLIVALVVVLVLLSCSVGREILSRDKGIVEGSFGFVFCTDKKSITVGSKTLKKLEKLLSNEYQMSTELRDVNNPELCFLECRYNTGRKSVAYYDPHTAQILAGVMKEGRVSQHPELLCLFATLKDRLWNKAFGQELSWQETDYLFPKLTYAKIEDFETGLCFNIQRRSGSRHADVQPVSRDDTAVMKIIYNNKWTWERRATILHVDGKKIAVSINGMPHGRGAIYNNEFSGHFCLHALDSTTHNTRKPDLAHQLMIKKAAGTLGDFLRNLAPELAFECFAALLTQNDYRYSLCCITNETEGEIQVLKKIDKLKVLELSVAENSEEMTVLTGKVSVVRHNSWHEEEYEVNPVMYYDAMNGWKLVLSSLLPFIT